MSIFPALLSFLLCILYVSADKAIPLITVKKNVVEGENQFVLNPNAIFKIEELPAPLKVIAAIGDARVGKSTALNFIHYSLDNDGSSAFHTEKVEEIFETGNTMATVTRGVWVSIVRKPGKHGMEHIILLDVEGTDIGDDTVTDKLSIFTALTSSTLMLFMKEAPSSHILDFLYKIVRLSEVAFGEKDSDNFPRLTAVLRGALEAPEVYKDIDHYITDALINSTWNDGSDEKRRAIGTRFPKEHITVFNLPYDANIRENPKSSKTLAGSEYLGSIENLMEHILQSPEKKSLGGAIVAGQVLADLIKSLVKVMNNKTLWNGLNPEFYALFEGHLCTKSYEKYIKPLLGTEHTSQYIEGKKEETLRLFKEKCTLSTHIEKAKKDIEIEIKRRRKEERNENYVNVLTHTLAGVVGFVIGAAAFSDVQLKEKLIVLKNSEYEAIGLRGVEWVWNQQAERLGLSGKGSGVVAQEVELLYPWAVTEGYDGYKRVNYLALRLLIWAKKFQRKLSCRQLAKIM